MAQHVAKEEIFKLPVIGRLMKYGGDIPLRRGDRSSVVTMMAECRRTLTHGMSIMMFPEGTRSTNGSLGRFKPGAFQLAIAAGVPVLPIAIARVLEPLPTDGLGPEDVPTLAARPGRGGARGQPALVRHRSRWRGVPNLETAVPPRSALF